MTAYKDYLIIQRTKSGAKNQSKNELDILQKFRDTRNLSENLLLDWKLDTFCNIAQESSTKPQAV